MKFFLQVPSRSIFSYFFLRASFLLCFAFPCFYFLSFEAQGKVRERTLFQKERLSQKVKSDKEKRDHQRLARQKAREKRFQQLSQSKTKGKRFQRLAEKKEELKAREVIIRFYRWPSLKQRKEIAKVLKTSGLKRTKNIKSYKAQLFGWKERGLKPSKEGERACVKLKNLPYVRRCQPDHLLPMNSLENSSRVFLKPLDLNRGMGLTEGRVDPFFLVKAEGGKRGETEASFVFECEDCKTPELEPIRRVTQQALDIRACGLVSDKQKLMGGNLSDYWAQELIGSDLLREGLEKTTPPDIENWIAVFDAQAGDHNIMVKNLISDEGLHAVLPELGEGKISFLDMGFQNNIDYREGRAHKPALSLYETSYPGDYLFGLKKRAPHYINNSMQWAESEDIYEVFQKLSSAKVSPPIVVLPSDNAFPNSKLDNIKNQASKDFDVILVGSLSPRGFVSEFSQSGKEIHIMAPSDYWITSAGRSGEWLFSGTSGAAPLVTGSLAGFEWLSGYHPTAKEAKILLEKTALPTLHSFEKPRINGAGLLNAYKLGEVAKRLKEKCKGQSVSCLKEEILKEETYRFSEDRNLKRDVSRHFPSCSIGRELGDSSSPSRCEEKGEVFKRLRKAVLLNPSQELLGSLSCLYKEGGFIQNAEAWEKLSLALGTEAEVRDRIRAIALREEPLSNDSLRLMLGMGGFEEEFKLFENERAMWMSVGVLEEQALPLLEKGFESGDLELQYAALRAAGGIGEIGLPLLEKGFENGDLELQYVALRAAVKIGEKAVPLLQYVLKKKNLQKKIFIN